jgi:F-box/leucine-rich repeat protein 2/20
MKPIDLRMMMKKGYTNHFPPSLHSWMMDKNLSSPSPSPSDLSLTPSTLQVPTLAKLCQQRLITQLEENCFNSKMVKDFCKYIPEELLEPIIEKLIENKKINDMILMIYLSPNRSRLPMNNLINIRNSIFKLIGYNCPHLKYLDLSDCIQISNSVIRVVLTGCPALETIKLDRCHRITDAAFDFSSIPFTSFVSCFSLECISLQECPQITGEVVYTLNKNCRALVYLSLSQCKHMKSNDLQYLFQHQHLKILNLSFIDSVTDETFRLLPKAVSTIVSSSSSPSLSSRPIPPPATPSIQPSPLQILNLCKCSISDKAMESFVSFSQLIELRLSWCTNITDQGIQFLVSYCSQLQYLDLTSCSITNKALAYLGKLCQKHLKELDLSWCMEINNDGLRYLLPMYSNKNEHEEQPEMSEEGNNRARYTPHCKYDSSDDCDLFPTYLERLHLVWCSQINNESLEILSNIPSLKYLAINGCNEVTAEAGEVLKRTGVEIIV